MYNWSRKNGLFCLCQTLSLHERGAGARVQARLDVHPASAAAALQAARKLRSKFLPQAVDQRMHSGAAFGDVSRKYVPADLLVAHEIRALFEKQREEPELLGGKLYGRVGAAQKAQVRRVQDQVGFPIYAPVPSSPQEILPDQCGKFPVVVAFLHEEVGHAGLVAAHGQLRLGAHYYDGPFRKPRIAAYEGADLLCGISAKAIVQQEAVRRMAPSQLNGLAAIPGRKDGKAAFPEILGQQL